MKLPELTAPTFTRMPVTIDGEWLDGPTLDFRGKASAEEPLVAVAFARQYGIRWAMSERPESDGSLSVRLILGRYDQDSLDVQVSFSIGGGQAIGRTDLFGETPPQVNVPLHVEAAHLFPFAIIFGSATVELYGLFLTRSDVRLGRNGLWNLKPQHRKCVAEPYLSLLTYGRKGEIADA